MFVILDVFGKFFHEQGMVLEIVCYFVHFLIGQWLLGFVIVRVVEKVHYGLTIGKVVEFIINVDNKEFI